jgi:hypothetical protein
MRIELHPARVQYSLIKDRANALVFGDVQYDGCTLCRSRL